MRLRLHGPDRSLQERVQLVRQQDAGRAGPDPSEEAGRGQGAAQSPNDRHPRRQGAQSQRHGRPSVC